MMVQPYILIITVADDTTELLCIRMWFCMTSDKSKGSLFVEATLKIAGEILSGYNPLYLLGRDSDT